MSRNLHIDPIPVDVRSEAWIRGLSLARFVRSNPPGGIDVSIVCFLVEVSATGRSFVQRDPTECVCVCVIECDQAQR